jgi:hypothetical protein
MERGNQKAYRGKGKVSKYVRRLRNTKNIRGERK